MIFDLVFLKYKTLNYLVDLDLEQCISELFVVDEPEDRLKNKQLVKSKV